MIQLGAIVVYCFCLFDGYLVVICMSIILQSVSCFKLEGKWRMVALIMGIHPVPSVLFHHYLVGI